MIFNLSVLKEILHDAEFKNFDESNFEFTFIDIVTPSSLKNKSIDKSKNLFIPVYETNFKKDGWSNNFDKREYLVKVAEENPNWVFVLNKSCPVLKKNMCIVVDDIFEVVDKIYQYVLSGFKGKVIAVTGSVGKTTNVGLIEKAISCQKKVLRIYSKRITPFILKSFIINFLDNSYEYIVLEMSFYRKHHVEVLNNLLTPDLAVISNIYNNHIDVDVKSQHEIIESKSKIFLNCKKCLVNFDDKLLNSYFKNSNSITPFFIDRNVKFLSNNYVEFSINGNNYTIEIFLLTKISIQQIYITLLILDYFNVNIEKSIKSIEEFKGVENRLQFKNLDGHTVLFV